MFTLKFSTDHLTMEEVAAVLRDVADRMEERKGANYAANVDGNIHMPEPHPATKIGTFRYKG